MFAADHIYRMDVRQMARFHQESGAEVSIAAVPMPIAKASEFGIMVSGWGGRVADFQEKPERPVPMPTDPDCAYVSMGNYLFNPEVLVELLEEASRSGETDFGRHLLPRITHSCRVFAYNFASNEIPGVKSSEERGYWRDVGTLEAYRDAQCDVMGPQSRFNLVNPEWPIRGSGFRVRAEKASERAQKISGAASGSRPRQATHGCGTAP